MRFRRVRRSLLGMAVVLVATFGTTLATTGVATASTAHAGYIAPGVHLFPGDYIYKFDAQYDQARLVLQGDGNMVLYTYFRNSPTEADPCWSTHTAGYGSNVYAVMQLDGNFVLYYNSSGTRGTYAIWASGTQGSDVTATVSIYTTYADSFRYAKLTVAGHSYGCDF